MACRPGPARERYAMTSGTPSAIKRSEPLATSPGEIIECTATEGFSAWMREVGGSLAVTTYQANKVIMVGWDGHRVTVLPREFERPMGLAVRGQSLAVATRQGITLLADASLLARDYLKDETGRFDALYLP